MFIWTISDAIGIALFVLFALAFAAVYLSIWWQQWRCKHQQGVNETRACDAICRSCGKTWGSSVRGVMPASKEQTMTEPTDKEQYLNVADQCAATATSELAASILVDGGNGTLRQLLTDAADAIRAGWATQAQAGAVPLTPEQVAEIANAAHREYDRLVASGQCAPRWSAVFAHLLESAHGIGIKGGQHGAE